MSEIPEDLRDLRAECMRNRNLPNQHVIVQTLLSVELELIERIAKAEAANKVLREQLTAKQSIIDKISELSGQPFTETDDHLVDWIKTILESRPNYAFREGVKAARELDTLKPARAALHSTEEGVKQ